MPVANLVTIFGFLIFSAFSGARVDVWLRLQSRATPSDSPPEALLSATPWAATPGSARDPRAPIRVRTEAPGSTSLYLYPSVDHLLEVTDGLWAPPIVLPSTDPPKELTVHASGTGVVRMELVNGTGHALARWPQAVKARFQLLETPLEVKADKSFETDCAVTMERHLGKEYRTLSCELPEGVLNVRLEAKGFIPLYLWELRMRQGALLELPAYGLEQGASLIGTAVLEDGLPADQAEVVLGPAVHDSVARAILAQESRSLEYRATADPRGFFQIRGIPQGSFDLRVRRPEYGLVTAPEVQISEPIEHRLDDPVTIPYFPAALVTVVPATDPADAPWSLLLFNPEGANRIAETDPQGRGQFELLPGGEYFLMVQGSDGQRWIAEQVRFSPEEPRVEIRIEQIPVVGSVTLDGEPLAADLYFGGSNGSESVRVRSEENGELFGVLPREGAWDVEIQAADPPVRVVERNVLVEIDSGLGAAEVHFELPGTRIAGRVIDETGAPAAGAQVIVQPGFLSGSRKSGIVQMESGADGGFALAGQRPGTYHAQALGSGGASSAVEVVEVTEGRSTPPVELSLRKARTVQGRVVSPNGSAVPGAVVWPIREVGSPGPLARVIRQTTTRSDGTFNVEVEAGGWASALAVLAPGFPLALDSLPGETEIEPIEIRLAPRDSSGRIVLEGARDTGGTLTIDGRWIVPLSVVVRSGRSIGTESEGAPVVILELPPAHYQICLHPERPKPTCTSGLLAPGNTLELDFKEESQ